MINFVYKSVSIWVSDGVGLLERSWTIFYAGMSVSVAQILSAYKNVFKCSGK